MCDCFNINLDQRLDEWRELVNKELMARTSREGSGPSFTISFFTHKTGSVETDNFSEQMVKRFSNKMFLTQTCLDITCFVVCLISELNNLNENYAFVTCPVVDLEQKTLSFLCYRKTDDVADVHESRSSIPFNEIFIEDQKPESGKLPIVKNEEES
jgi:hypothetical protein